MQRFLIIILLCFPILLPAQADSTGSDGFGFGGAFGSLVVGGKAYTQIRLMPELRFGKFGIGLDVDLLIDDEGKIREEDWDDAEDYLNKILYIRYGRRGDPFYGRIGSFPSYTLAHGLIMNGYTNMLRYPEERQVGLQLGGTLPVWSIGVEGFTANLAKNNILAARVTARPLQPLEIPLISRLTFGGSYVTDRNQYEGLLDQDGDDYPDAFDDYPEDDDYHDELDKLYPEYFDDYATAYGDSTGWSDWWDTFEMLHGRFSRSFEDLGEDDISAWGLDYELPVIEGDYFYLSHYGEMAQIMEHNMGFIFPGFYAKFLIFHMNLEFRYYQDDFEPAFFDRLYDENRVRVAADSSGVDVLITKEDLIEFNKESRGWFGSVTADIFNILQFTVAYEDMYGTDVRNGKSIWSTLMLKPDVIPIISTLRADWSQTREEHVLEHLRTPNTIFTAQAGYQVSPVTEIIATYQERYVDLNGNGEIGGAEETIKTSKVGVQVRF